MIYCNGYINFGNVGGSSQQAGAIEIGAKGNCGEEKIALLLDNKQVAEWALTTDISVYSYANYKTNQSIKVAFVNDVSNGCDLNVYVDWIKVCGTQYQTEDTASRTGCGNSEWLFCNGNFDFGNLGCDDGKDPNISETKETFIVYPNPVTENEITITGSLLYNLTLFSIDGKKVYEAKDVSDTKTITIASLKNGMYILRLFDQQTKTNKIQKVIIDNQ